MSACIENPVFQIVGAGVGMIMWISVCFNLLRIWYIAQPLKWVVAVTAASGCVALALQCASTGIKLVLPLIR